MSDGISGLGGNGFPSRRAFLRGAAALPVAYALSGLAKSNAEQQGEAKLPILNSGLVLRQRQPENLEFPFQTLDGFITPNERFYIRNHFAVPKIDKEAWRLKVEGAVAKPLELSLDDLHKLESKTVTATLECAGNSRGFLIPKENGVLWESGAVSTAKWKGVSLAQLLERAGVKDNAVDVVLVGADSGAVADPKSPGAINFARSLPLNKARKESVLVAYEMNDAPLPTAHGYPLRAVVGGWYGMASIKWLTGVIVTTTRFDGFHQSIEYSYFERQNGQPSLVPITEMQVKSAIARPALMEVVPAGKKYRMHGAAWAGESTVTKIEVSADGGRTWKEAKLLSDPVDFCWRLWEHHWDVPLKAGRYTVMARATDARGRKQPMERDLDRRSYMISHVLPIEVEVKG
jgi:DMSO/TMAO reductase YedYZ molybdopterin-dependent catalytic subunit